MAVEVETTHETPNLRLTTGRMAPRGPKCLVTPLLTIAVGEGRVREKVFIVEAIPMVRVEGAAIRE